MMGEKPRLPETSSWPPETEEWFNVWRESPITDSWSDAQWQHMFTVALLHATIYGQGNFGMIGMLSAEEKFMGLTFDEAPAQQAEVKVTSFDRIKGKFQDGPARREATA